MSYRAAVADEARLLQVNQPTNKAKMTTTTNQDGTETDKMGKTRIISIQPWGIFQRKGTRVLCSDGVIRSVQYVAQTPDTFFSIPAAVRVNGQHVSGYITAEENRTTFKRAFIFRHYSRHADKLPKWPDLFTTEHAQLIAKAF